MKRKYNRRNNRIANKKAKIDNESDEDYVCESINSETSSSGSSIIDSDDISSNSSLELDSSEIEYSDEEITIVPINKSRLRTSKYVYKNDSLPTTEQHRRSVVAELITSLNTVCYKNTEFIQFIKKNCLNESTPFLAEIQYDTTQNKKINYFATCCVCERGRSLSTQLRFVLNNTTYMFSIGCDCFKRIDNFLKSLRCARNYFIHGIVDDGHELEKLLYENTRHAQNIRKKYIKKQK